MPKLGHPHSRSTFPANASTVFAPLRPGAFYHPAALKRVADVVVVVGAAPLPALVFAVAEAPLVLDSATLVLLVLL